MIAIFQKELRQYFLTPVGYVFISAFLAISGLMFSLQNLFGASKDFAATLSGLVFVFLVVVPILTMRLFTDERGQQTETLLFTSPIHLRDVVFGKFAAAVTVFFLTLLITMIYPLIMSLYGYLDWPVIFGTYIGFFLLGCAFISAGTLISDISDSQSSAAIMTFCLLLSSWIIDFIRPFIPTSQFSGFLTVLVLAGIFCIRIYQVTKHIRPVLITAVILLAGSVLVIILAPNLYGGLLLSIISAVSVTGRFAPFALGIIDLGTVTYYLAIIIACLYLTTARLERRRWAA